jgi:hypothetical protein
MPLPCRTAERDVLIKRADAAFTQPSLNQIALVPHRTNNHGFQLFGIGKFLLNLLFRFAHNQCETPAVYLKTNRALQDFYLGAGYEPIDTLPTLLLAVVPSSHTMTDDETLLLTYKPTPVATTPSIGATAARKKPRRRGKKKKATPRTADQISDEPTYSLEIERTSQNKIAKVLEFASSEPEGDSDDSDKSGAGNEANTYDSYKRYPTPPESTEWDATEHGKDYWEQEGEQKFLTMEHSKKQHLEKHQSTQQEINALYGDTTLRKALGCYQIIQRARNYQMDTGFIHRLYKDRDDVSTK